MAAPVPDFVYTRLKDPDEYFRLLELLPSTQTNDSVRGIVTAYRRDEAPSYRPVSYTWGEEPATSKILLKNTGDHDWQHLSIKPNLETLLKQFRTSLDMERVTIWVDAICIDQNHAEKGHQVRNMDKVYRGQCLAIWLGEHSEDSDLAMDLIEKFAVLLVRSSRDVAMQNVSSLNEHFDQFFESISNPPSVWRALYNLMSRPWFKRRWIVQEFVLSKDQQLWVGDRAEHAGFLGVLAGLLEARVHQAGEQGGRETRNFCQKNKDVKHPLPYDIGPLERIRCLRVAQTTTAWDDNLPELTLERLLDGFSSLKSFDSRDGIYAFLSMASDVDTSKWLPDYSSGNDAMTLYGQVVLHTLNESGSLDMICHCAYGVFGFPSWVPYFGLAKAIVSMAAVDCRIPDCTREDHGHYMCVHEVSGYKHRSLTTWGQPLKRLKHGEKGRIENVRCSGCKECITGNGLRCLKCDDFDICHICAEKSDSIHDPNHCFAFHNGSVYSASGGTSINRSTTLNCVLTLECTGFIVDTIKAVEYSDNETTRLATGIEIGLPVQEWKVLPGMENHIDNNGSLSDRFFRTLTGNRQVHQGHVCHITDSWISAVRKLFEMHFDGETPLGEGDVEKNGRWLAAAASIEFMVSDQRKFATTTDMKSIGFVPQHSKPGDSIAILIGCSVPVVIRKRGACEEKDGWELIGECYIDGVMEGELMPKYWKNEVDVQKFKLT